MNKTNIKSLALHSQVLLPKSKRYNWFEIKKDFLANPTVTYQELAKTYKVSPKTIIQKARTENWLMLRNEIMKRAEERVVKETEKKLSEIKLRHSTMGKMLQSEGIKAIKSGKRPRTAKEALQFTVEGVRIEREAEGVEQKQPNIVNIIQQQRSIIDHYKTEEGEVVEEGK